MCVGTPDRDVLSLGVDIEPELSPKVVAEIHAHVVDSREAAVLRKDGGRYTEALTIVFRSCYGDQQSFSTLLSHS